MNTVQYKCPNCGGELVFNPEKQMFSCPYCMSDFTEAEMEERYHTQNETAQKEADADAKTLKDENDEAAFEEHTRLYECPSCGAQIIADETTSATFCYYCHNPVVLAGRLKGNYKPAYVLPFAVQRDAAEKEFRAWCRKRWFLPSDFRSKQQLEKRPCICPTFPSASNAPLVLPTDSNAVAETHFPRPAFLLQNYTQPPPYPFRWSYRVTDLLFSKPSDQSSPQIHLHRK